MCCYKPINEWYAITLAYAGTCQYLLRCAIAHAKLYLTS